MHHIVCNLHGIWPVKLDGPDVRGWVCAPARCYKTSSTSPCCACRLSFRQRPFQPPVCRLQLLGTGKTRCAKTAARPKEVKLAVQHRNTCCMYRPSTQVNLL